MSDIEQLEQERNISVGFVGAGLLPGQAGTEQVPFRADDDLRDETDTCVPGMVPNGDAAVPASPFGVELVEGPEDEHLLIVDTHEENRSLFLLTIVDDGEARVEVEAVEEILSEPAAELQTEKVIEPHADLMDLLAEQGITLADCVGVSGREESFLTDPRVLEVILEHLSHSGERIPTLSSEAAEEVLDQEKQFRISSLLQALEKADLSTFGVRRTSLQKLRGTKQDPLVARLEKVQQQLMADHPQLTADQVTPDVLLRASFFAFDDVFRVYREGADAPLLLDTYVITQYFEAASPNHIPLVRTPNNRTVLVLYQGSSFLLKAEIEPGNDETDKCSVTAAKLSEAAVSELRNVSDYLISRGLAERHSRTQS